MLQSESLHAKIASKEHLTLTKTDGKHSLHNNHGEVTALVPIRPLLKWAGGKRRLLKHIIPLVPSATRRYFEPFFGGGALFFALRPKAATLGDRNRELIECYAQVKRDPNGVIAELRKLRNGEDEYYRVRASQPISHNARAARFLYLTTLSFNGIYRQNLSGQFNVPYGFKTHIDPAEHLRITEISEALRSASLKAGDFEKIVADAKSGDLIYFDPPYTVAHSNNGFVKYNATIFSWADQVRLSHCAARLASIGCTVIVSNADHPSIEELYPSFTVVRLSRPSVIAASKAFRKMTTECIFFRKDPHIGSSQDS